MFTGVNKFLCNRLKENPVLSCFPVLEVRKINVNRFSQKLLETFYYKMNEFDNVFFPSC